MFSFEDSAWILEDCLFHGGDCALIIFHSSVTNNEVIFMTYVISWLDKVFPSNNEQKQFWPLLLRHLLLMKQSLNYIIHNKNPQNQKGAHTWGGNPAAGFILIK